MKSKKIKVYKINNPMELGIFNKIYSSNISSKEFPYYGRYGKTYWDEDETPFGWTKDLSTYHDIDYELCSFFNDYLNQL